MISCQNAKRLFDRYLDGELPSSLQTELHAHRLNCTDCQNELGMVEACVDVIAADRCEPVLSGSFTDRLMAARKAQLKPQKRHWGRVLLMIGSPLAAAASIAFAVMLISPSMQHRSVIASRTESAPKEIRSLLGDGTKQLTPEAKVELARTPEMPANGFLESLLAPFVEKSRDTLEGTKRSAAELAMLVQMGLADKDVQIAKGQPVTPAVHPMESSDPAAAPLNDSPIPQDSGSPSTERKYEPL
jgi:hypothetical protein